MLKILIANILAVSLAVISPIGVAASGSGKGEIVTTASEQQEVAVTIYNDNLALVKDSRRVGLGAGFNKLAWREVSAQMQPETAQLRNLTHADGFRLQEQNFDFDLLTPQTLLDKYLGKEVMVIRVNPATGKETTEAATVLATNNGAILKYADRIESGIPGEGRLAFRGVPENLRDKPTLVVSLITPVSGEQNLELSYLTTGLSWRADYVAELNEHDDHLDLNGWVTLTNQSGATYPDARLQLVAGDLNRVRQQQPVSRKVMGMSQMAEAMDMKQEVLFEYHLYTLQRPASLAENQTKQVALMSATNVPVRKEFLLIGADYYYSGRYDDIGRKLKVAVFVEFMNKGAGLGIPLPKGITRVYKKDGMGNAQFVGEDQIDHTPANEAVRLKLGNAFDVTAEKKQTDFKSLDGEKRYSSIYETAHQIVLKNAKKQPVVVTVREPVPGDWTMVSESQPHTKVASGVAEWQVSIPADGKTTLSYRVRVKYKDRN
ncbi:DUF4139 domain-containing protein [Nitrosovibrio sp. Nv4]|uniref:DUF4139 domain-containing protein n=1 Tax=Nitrosovibrio sp. Nv4 TaxID=1945880 RepID=UPI000BD60D86|nr:DUF4139 domain-containing protein [Nitrosovibrio sp. Nv4]SOD42067.1 hypothetical protein SAMN06298226_2394 [Nitrosovibrio sp. Nv4]